jgi:ubiquinone/menaquinone biosynthesis C-methylase UbiE
MNQQKVWDAIAVQWNNFRQKPFSDVDKILSSLSAIWKKGKIVDIGCGNARNLLIFANKGFKAYGMDFSGEMLKHAKAFAKKNVFNLKLMKARAEKLPYKNNFFDYALSIAVLHHLDKVGQVRSLNEMKRVLKKNGKAVITVWNKWQLRFLFSKKELTVPWHIQGKVYQRYYYMFNYFELKSLLKKLGFKILYSGSIFNKNLIFIVEK